MRCFLKDWSETDRCALYLLWARVNHNLQLRLCLDSLFCHFLVEKCKNREELRQTICVFSDSWRRSFSSPLPFAQNVKRIVILENVAAISRAWRVSESKQDLKRMNVYKKNSPPMAPAAFYVVCTVDLLGKYCNKAPSLTTWHASCFRHYYLPLDLAFPVKCSNPGKKHS
jgi:hypothetical protein